MTSWSFLFEKDALESQRLAAEHKRFEDGILYGLWWVIRWWDCVWSWGDCKMIRKIECLGGWRVARCLSCCAKHHVEEICFSLNRRVDSKTRVIPCKDIHIFFRLELIEVTQTSLSRWHASVFISPIQQSLKPDPGGNVSPEPLLGPNFACFIFLTKKARF